MDDQLSDVTTGGALVVHRLPGWQRSVQRFLTPRSLVTLWLYLRDHATISWTSSVQLTDRIRFGRGSVVKAFSVVQTSGGRVTFGRRCAISSFNHIAAGGDADLLIGDDFRTGPGVRIVATSHNWRDADRPISEQGFNDQGITIGDDVWIGANSVVLDGSHIGDRAVISANSLVKGDVPANAVMAGSPAVQVSERT